MTLLVQMFPLPGWWKSLAASVAGLVTGKELLSFHPGPGACVEVWAAPWLKPSLAGQLLEDGLGVEVTVDALSGNLLMVLCDVCCFIP